MTENTTPQMVVSGVPYTVVSVDGRAAVDLDDFVGLGHFVVTGQTGEHQVAGEGDRHEDEVRFYEKTLDGIGKDVRVWKVVATDDGFCAEAAV
jgi:hypothetical protein